MNSTKINVTFLFPVIVFFLLSSCSGTRYIPPNAPAWALGTVKTSDPSKIRISSVDGKQATGTYQGNPVKELPDTVKIQPGYHVIIPCYIDRKNPVCGGELSFFSQGDQMYTLYYKIKWDKSIRFWVENNGIDITTEN